MTVKHNSGDKKLVIEALAHEWEYIKEACEFAATACEKFAEPQTLNINYAAIKKKEPKDGD
jgi:hypothetical protein